MIGTNLGQGLSCRAAVLAALLMGCTADGLQWACTWDCSCASTACWLTTTEQPSLMESRVLLARAAACQTQHHNSDACLPGCLQIVRWGTSLPALHEQNNQDVVWAKEAAKKLVTRAIVDLQSALGSSWAEVSSSYTAKQMPSVMTK